MGSASDEDGSTLAGRRAEWNLSAPWGRSVPVRDERLQDRALWVID
jgi:hypothetical protein